VTLVTHTPQLDERALALNAFSDETALDEELPEVVVSPDETVPEGDPPRHLRVAPSVSKGVLRRRRRARFAVLGVAAISAASMFLLVAFHVFAVQSAFQLDKLDSQLKTEQRRYGLLRNEVDRKSSPEAVATQAERLGMQRSPTVKVLRVPGMPFGSATAAFPVPPKTPYAPLQAVDARP
jgi:cell division protein FtsL